MAFQTASGPFMTVLGLQYMAYIRSIISRILYYLNKPFINQKQFQVSVMRLLVFSLVLLVAIAASRYLRNLLKSRVLPRASLDTGLQYSLLRVIHYLIITLGVLYGLKIGFEADLTSIAVILGFLSVGIGFGLQFIAADVVSGFILLFERPLRLGDRIKLENVEGRVSAIRIRSTTIVTGDNLTVVLPNAELVRKQIVNWSSSDRIRLKLPVCVAYGGDIKRVSEILIQAATAVTETLKDPAPKVHLKSFGDSSVSLELLVWIESTDQHAQVSSDINFQIERLLRENNISLAAPPAAPIPPAKT